MIPLLSRFYPLVDSFKKNINVCVSTRIMVFFFNKSKWNILQQPKVNHPTQNVLEVMTHSQSVAPMKRSPTTKKKNYMTPIQRLITDNVTASANNHYYYFIH